MVADSPTVLLWALKETCKVLQDRQVTKKPQVAIAIACYVRQLSQCWAEDSVRFEDD